MVFPNQYINGVLDVEAGTATGTVADVVIGKNEGSYFDAIVIPGSNHQWNAGDVFAKITVDGNEYEIVPNNFPSTIEAGKNYNFNTTLDKSEVKVSATIADWDVVNADNASSQLLFTSSLNGTNDANASKEIGNYTLYQKGTGEGTTFSKVTDAKWNETTKIWENTPTSIGLTDHRNSIIRCLRQCIDRRGKCDLGFRTYRLQVWYEWGECSRTDHRKCASQFYPCNVRRSNKANNN